MKEKMKAKNERVFEVNRWIDIFKTKFKKTVDELLYKFNLRNENHVIEEYERQAKEAESLGKDLREYIFFLYNRNGFKVDDRLRENRSSSLDFRLEDIKQQLNAMQPGQKKESLKEIKNSPHWLASGKDSYHELEDETGQVYGFYNAVHEVKTEKEKHFIIEDVITPRNKDEKGEKEIIDSMSELLIVFEDGSVLDFGTLLPPGYVFAPTGPVLDEISACQKKNTGKTFLEEKSEEFVAFSSLKKIKYGDLRTKGGIYGLLHEIGHVWKNEIEGSEAADFYLDLL